MNKNIKFSIIIFLILIFILVIYFFDKKENRPIKKNTETSKDKTSLIKENNKTIQVTEITKSIFIPYWSLNSIGYLNNYDRVIYFGLSGKVNGIDKNDQGYTNLEKFNNLNIDMEKYLTLRMTNTDENIRILKDKNAMTQIIEQTLKIAKENHFRGVVLDLEMSVLFGNEIPNQINYFSNELYKKLKENNIKYSIAIYGDVFYRKRPYDIQNLAKNSEEIMIMAYDFHKSIGEPGPNFPLNGKENYNYDMEVMINDFLRIVPQDKITVIFGLYGYDWIVDEKQRPIKPAVSLSLNQIKDKYLNNCIEPKCKIARDKASKENKINVKDLDGRDHIIWFEDERSVEEKIKFLRSLGISNFAYWAYSYF